VGTPAWYWDAAGDTYATADYLKTADHLESLVDPDSEYADRAQPFRLVVTGGLATGYISLADSFEAGAKAKKANPTPFFIQMNNYRKWATGQALQFAETFLAFQQRQKEGNIPIAFGYPKGSALPIPELAKLAEGAMLSETDIAVTEKRALDREVLMIACGAVGASEDTAKAQEILRGESVEVPREVFVCAMASKLHELSDLYSPDKLGQPERMQLFCDKALEALKALPETDNTKNLVSKIEKDMKAAKGRP
jgi:hypothetical protein